MLRVLIMGIALRIGRRTHPEMFDPVAALASVEGALADYDGPS